MHNTRKKNKMNLPGRGAQGKLIPAKAGAKGVAAAAKPFNVLFVGVGGQGIVLASDILALAALSAGYDVKKSEVHGMSQRGGSVFAHVRFGKKIYSPVISRGGADVIVSLEEMETLRWLDYAGQDTRFIVVKTRILPSGTSVYPEGAEDFLKRAYRNAVFLDPSSLAERLEGQKFINTALIGVLSRYLDIKTPEFRKAVEKCVPAGTAEKNLAAFDIGQSEARP